MGTWRNLRGTFGTDLLGMVAHAWSSTTLEADAEVMQVQDQPKLGVSDPVSKRKVQSTHVPLRNSLKSYLGLCLWSLFSSQDIHSQASS